MSSIFRHYKGGIYKPVCTAVNSETGERLVIYEGLDGKIWARPEKMFKGTVWVDGKEVYRFENIGQFNMCR
ncbi:DUF1653 domain-containing protein [Sediminibacillus massiliensis]|uniref:DUF1653 domain-containing protein n=1 Tax=Sediminibacillus massiliensis TaxID=1926277 RepID=UPI0009883325|nr:DUF1653 domain-containing protein [Sediminibacillus massiliensis]